MKTNAVAVIARIATNRRLMIISFMSLILKRGEASYNPPQVTHTKIKPN